MTAITTTAAMFGSITNHSEDTTDTWYVGRTGPLGEVLANNKKASHS